MRAVALVLARIVCLTALEHNEIDEVHADAFAGQVPWGEAPATAAVFLDTPFSEPFQEGHWTQMDKLHHADDGDVGSLCAAPIPGTNASSSGLRCEGQGVCRCV